VFWKKTYDRANALATADKARARGRARKAVRWYREILSHDDADLAVHARLAPLLAKLRKWDDAKKSFDKAAKGFLTQGFAPKAIAVWTVAAQTFPEQVEYWERIANLQAQLGKRADAVLALLQGRSMLTKKRQRPLAALLLRQVLELQPGHIEASLDLADLLRRDGVRDEAKRLLNSLLVRVGKGRLRRRVRFAQLRLEPSLRGALNWAFAR
jgi:tetratricopeptide (TPR) repeat protein